MKGYNSIKEYIEDYKLFIVSSIITSKVSFRHMTTLSDIIMRKINLKNKKATPKFHQEMEQKALTKFDIEIIARHDIAIKDADLYDLMGNAAHNPLGLRKLLRSTAFKQGMIPNISRVLPLNVKSSEELKLYIIRSLRKYDIVLLEMMVSVTLGKKGEKWMGQMYNDPTLVRFMVR